MKATYVTDQENWAVNVRQTMVKCLVKTLTSRYNHRKKSINLFMNNAKHVKNN